MEQVLNIANPQEGVRTGSCLCGNIKYQLTGQPLNAVLCNCVNCKKTSGAAAWCNGWFWKNQISIATSSPSTLKSYQDKDTDSGQPLHREFCANCGSPLFLKPPQAPDLVVVSLGSLDKYQRPWEPKMEVYAQDSFGWTPQAEDVKIFEGPLDLSNVPGLHMGDSV